MKDIYQRIWDADQAQNGITPILENQEGDSNKGYVKVSENLESTDDDLRVLTDVVIPESKKKTYDLCKKLFDNYSLSEKDEEFDTPEERQEIHDFISAIIETAPMQVAKEYISHHTGTSLSKERWYNTVMEMWFRTFQQSGEPHLSGFEHVIVGEQDGPKAQGYHFWYKYYLDDGFAREVDGIHQDAFPNLSNDRILYNGTKQSGEQYQHPETVTISFKWNAADYYRQALRPLYKKIGGFFVGCSVEGLIALGTVRAHLGINAPKKAIINGAEYAMKLYHSDNRRHIRTFYPKFLRSIREQPIPTPPIPTPIPSPDPVPVPVSTEKIRIIAAMVNPKGNDVGKETVVLINTHSEAISLNNWSIVDKNNKTSLFTLERLEPGDTYKIILDGKGAQLSNKGGSINLFNEKKERVHFVSYSAGQVENQGNVLVF
ncbi:lamin tail domain-containing protein [Flavobacteriaceae bacterium MHTCC 0001]